MTSLAWAWLQTMQLAILTGVLAAFVSAERGGGPVSGVAWRLAAVMAAMLAPPVAAVLSSGRILARSVQSADRDRKIDRFRSLAMAAWLAAVVIVMFAAQWPQVVRGNWQLARWPLVDEIAVLAPAVAALLLMWAAFYRLETAAEVAPIGWQSLVQQRSRLAAYLWLHARHDLGLILLPPLALAGLFDVLGMMGIRATNMATGWFVGLAAMAATLAAMPLAIRRLWPTSPLPAGPLRDGLAAICRERNCHVREILVWHTRGTMANAAVVGLSRRLRYMLLTDMLLAKLSANQIAAVVRHEAAHLRRRHLPARLALLLAPLALWLAASTAWPTTAAGLTAFARPLAAQWPLLSVLALPLAMLVHCVVVVGSYSRMLEHDADLDACLTAAGHFDRQAADDFCQALITIAGRSRESRLSQWLHPAVGRRVQFLADVSRNEACGTAFRRRVHSAAVGIALLYVTAAAIAACSVLL